MLARLLQRYSLELPANSPAEDDVLFKPQTILPGPPASPWWLASRSLLAVPRPVGFFLLTADW